jgi:hypothetical protein
MTEVIMKEYYCERFDIMKPEFPNYKGNFKSDGDALKFFKECHGNKLQCVYDDTFKMIWESKNDEDTKDFR